MTLLIGGTIRVLRKRRGLTRVQLAARLGTSPGTLREIERDKNGVSVDRFGELADALGLNFAQLAWSAEHGGQEPHDLERMNLLVSSTGTRGAADGEWNDPSDIDRLRPWEAAKRIYDDAAVHALMREHGWTAVERLGLRAREHFDRGTDDWVEITLHYCARMCQQSGQVARASAHIFDAEQAHRDLRGANGDRRMLGLLDHERGWLAIGQLGDPVVARAAFLRSARHAAAVGDDALVRANAFFIVRALTEELMHGTGAWLEARPDTSFPAELGGVHEKLEKWTASKLWRSLTENPEANGRAHQMHRQFLVDSLLLPPQESRLRLDARRADLELLGAGHLHALGVARMAIAQFRESGRIQHLGVARDAADFAGAAYRAQRYPRGIALAAATGARARLGMGIATEAASRIILDGWVLSRLLHPYAQNPLASASWRGLDATARQVAAADPRWLRGYLLDLRDRVKRGDGAFAALHGVEADLGSIVMVEHLFAKLLTDGDAQIGGRNG